MAASETDPLVSFGAAARPGLIWGCASESGRGALFEEGEPLGPGFRWLHLNLADQRSLRWIDRCAGLSPAVRALFVSPEILARVAIEGETVGMVLPDFERDFEPGDTGSTSAMHIAVTPTLMLTGRYRPVSSADLVKRRIAAGAPLEDAASALELMLGAITEGLSARALDATTELLAAEEDLLADRLAPDTRALVGLRRQTSQLHRMAGSTRATLARAEGDRGLPAALAPVIERAMHRLVAIDADVGSAQSQLRLLRDELDLQAAQRTNENVYFLSIVTALMMPATLVTGFFGMNTGNMPFSGQSGTAEAGLIAILTSVATYIGLRMMGLVKR